MRTRIVWLGIVATLALPASSSAAESTHHGLRAHAPSFDFPPEARSALAEIGQVVWITANTRSAQAGRNLRVAIKYSSAGTRSPAVLKAPENRPTHPNLRRAQQWRVERITITNHPSYRFRNVYSDKCLTAARPHASPVYLQYCGNILGQAWSFQASGMLWSMNYNQTFPLGCSCTTLDIPNYRNVVDTQLVAANHSGAWNQLWDVSSVPSALR